MSETSRDFPKDLGVGTAIVVEKGKFLGRQGNVVEKSHGWFKVKLNGTDEMANVRGGDLRVLASGSSSLTSAVTPAKPGKPGKRSRSPPASAGKTISGELNAKAPQGARRKSMFPAVSASGGKPTAETSTDASLQSSDPASAEDSRVGDSTEPAALGEAGISQDDGERTPGRKRRVSSKRSSDESRSPLAGGKVPAGAIATQTPGRRRASEKVLTPASSRVQALANSTRRVRKSRASLPVVEERKPLGTRKSARAKQIESGEDELARTACVKQGEGGGENGGSDRADGESGRPAEPGPVEGPGEKGKAGLRTGNADAEGENNDRTKEFRTGADAESMVRVSEEAKGSGAAGDRDGKSGAGDRDPKVKDGSLERGDVNATVGDGNVEPGNEEPKSGDGERSGSKSPDEDEGGSSAQQATLAEDHGRVEGNGKRQDLAPSDEETESEVAGPDDTDTETDTTARAGRRKVALRDGLVPSVDRPRGKGERGVPKRDGSLDIGGGATDAITEGEDEVDGDEQDPSTAKRGAGGRKEVGTKRSPRRQQVESQDVERITPIGGTKSSRLRGKSKDDKPVDNGEKDSVERRKRRSSSDSSVRMEKARRREAADVDIGDKAEEVDGRGGDAGVGEDGSLCSREEPGAVGATSENGARRESLEAKRKTNCGGEVAGEHGEGKGVAVGGDDPGGNGIDQGEENERAGDGNSTSGLSETGKGLESSEVDEKSKIDEDDEDNVSGEDGESTQLEDEPPTQKMPLEEEDEEEEDKEVTPAISPRGETQRADGSEDASGRSGQASALSWGIEKAVSESGHTQARHDARDGLGDRKNTEGESSDEDTGGDGDEEAEGDRTREDDLEDTGGGEAMGVEEIAVPFLEAGNSRLDVDKSVQDSDGEDDDDDDDVDEEIEKKAGVEDTDGCEVTSLEDESESSVKKAAKSRLDVFKTGQESDGEDEEEGGDGDDGEEEGEEKSESFAKEGKRRLDVLKWGQESDEQDDDDDDDGEDEDEVDLEAMINLAADAAKKHTGTVREAKEPPSKMRKKGKGKAPNPSSGNRKTPPATLVLGKKRRLARADRPAGLDSGLPNAKYIKYTRGSKKEKAVIEASVSSDALGESKVSKLVSASDLYSGKGRATVPGRTKAPKDTSAGKGWFNMERTEMTAELKRDLQVIKMRNYMDPKKFYKSSDKPSKFLQVGTVKEGLGEFFSARLSKKERKKTLVDELLVADEQFRAYSKKQSVSIRERKSKGGKAHYKALMQKRKPKPSIWKA